MKNLAAVSFFFLFISSLNAQVTFQKSYAGGNNIYPYALLTLNNGDYLAAGFAGNASNWYGFLMRLDQYGDTIWTRSYMDSLNRFTVNNMIRTSDGGFVLSGSRNSFNTTFTGNDAVVMKTDSMGHPIWARTFSAQSFASGLSVVEMASGSLFIAGTFANFSNPLGYFLLELDANGNTLLSRTFDCGITVGAMSMQKTSDGGLILGASIDTGNVVDHYNASLIKFDSVGAVQWTRIYDIAPCSTACVQQTADGGYILAGTRSDNATYANFFLLKTDAAGNGLWARTYQSCCYDNAAEVRELPGGEFIVAAFSYGFTSTLGNYNAVLMKTDSSGVALWTRYYGANGNAMDLVNELKLTSDGGYVMLGRCDGYGSLIKTDSAGNAGCNSYTASFTETSIAATSFSGYAYPTTVPGATPSGVYPYFLYCAAIDYCLLGVDDPSAKGLHVFPNPSSGAFTFSGCTIGDELSIYASDGRIVYACRTVSTETTIDLSSQPAGLFHYRITGAGGQDCTGTILLR